jgi:aryl-alcohol dehydrogenase-like predicted oxidoreductase
MYRRYFDAARSYGRAEEFLGGWLAARGIGPDEVAVGSKWGYTYTANWQGISMHCQCDLYMLRAKS